MFRPESQNNGLGFSKMVPCNRVVRVTMLSNLFGDS
jgi:hypothetical protein